MDQAECSALVDVRQGPWAAGTACPRNKPCPLRLPRLAWCRSGHAPPQERIVLKTGEVSSEITYGITSLPFPCVGAAALEQFWRGHWTIENRVHGVRDGTMRKDAGQIHAGHAAHTLAALRNAILNLFRHHGWTNIADAFRHYAASVQEALDLIGATTT